MTYRIVTRASVVFVNKDDDNATGLHARWSTVHFRPQNLDSAARHVDNVFPVSLSYLRPNNEISSCL